MTCLRCILVALCEYDPHLAYSRGLCHIGALLLLVFGTQNEEVRRGLRAQQQDKPARGLRCSGRASLTSTGRRASHLIWALQAVFFTLAAMTCDHGVLAGEHGQVLGG